MQITDKHLETIKMARYEVFAVYEERKLRGYYNTRNQAAAAIIEHIDVMDKNIYPIPDSINYYPHRRSIIYNALISSTEKGLKLGDKTYYIKQKELQKWYND